MNSRYFYTDDNGNIKKYIYCSRGCFEPYKQEDLGTLIYRANEHTCICKKCVNTLGMKSDELFKKESKEFVDDNLLIEDLQDINFVENKNNKNIETYVNLLEEFKDTPIATKKNKKVTKINEELEEDIEDEDEKEISLDEVQDTVMIDEDEKENNLDKIDEVQDTVMIDNDKVEENKGQTAIIVFVCQCKDKTYYCGITTNLKNAIKYHNQGCGGSYTKPKERRPVILVETKEVSSQEEAKKIKKEMIEKYK